VGRRRGGLNRLPFSHFQPQQLNLLVLDHRAPEVPATWPESLGSAVSHMPSARPGVCNSNCRRPAKVIVADHPRHLEAEEHELRPSACAHCGKTALDVVDELVEEKLH